VLWLARGQLRREPLAIDPAARRITLAGSVLPFVVSVAIVVLRYTFGYLYGRYPELVTDPDYALALIGGAAFLGGITFGRYGRLALWYWRATKPAATAESAQRG